MKKFICGFVVGAILCSAIGVFAAQYIADTATFKVLVNGEEFVSDPPALVVEGRTYLPLRAMGDALGVPVTWNEELGQAEVGTTPVSNEKEAEQKIDEPELLTKKEDQVYKENNNIVNFGHIIGKDAKSVKTSDDYIAYVYDVSGEIVNPLRQYEYLLKDIGFIVSCDGKELTARYEKEMLNLDYTIYAEYFDDVMFVMFKKLN